MNVPLSSELLSRIERAAAARGQSVADFLEALLDRTVADPNEGDPLFSDTAVFNGPCPADVSVNHDAYLYGDPE